MKNYIEKIHEIKWSEISPFQIMFASLVFAKEFSQTARYFISDKPGFGSTSQFREFIAGEIDTDNLVYDDYNRQGDHWEFLTHFMSKDNFRDKLKKHHAVTSGKLRNSFGLEEYGVEIFFDDSLTTKAIDQYQNYIETLHGEHRMATLVSREKYLHGIFQKVLESHDWDTLGFGFFRYFLERHIELDSSENGHDNLMSQVLDLEKYDFYMITFWHFRWKIYATLK